MRSLLVAALLAACAGVPLASAGTRHAIEYPSAMAVIGTPTAAGWGADPAHPFHPAPKASWATGTDPAVRSIYSRLVALNPAIRGHNANLSTAVSAPEAAGHELDDLLDGVHRVLRLKVKPDLVIVQAIDRAVKCDGSTELDFASYGARFGSALQVLAKGLPNARIFVVSQWGSFASYVKYLQGLDAGHRLKNAGKKPCQLVASPTGAVVPSRVAYAKRVVAGEEAQLRSACTKVAHCRYDGGAAQRIPVTAADIADFQFTPTVQGQAKIAAAEWKLISTFVKGAS